MIDFFIRGGPVMYPILLCSIIAVAITIERFISLYIADARNRRFIAEAKDAPGGETGAAKIMDAAARIPCPVATILTSALDHIGDPEEQRNAILQRVGSRERRALERNINTLGVIAHISPLLGLLGTVTGMIRAFMTVQRLGGQVEASDLAGGIWEALITTAAGLFVAIPALFIYHLLENRVDDIVASIKDTALVFPEILGRYRIGPTERK